MCHECGINARTLKMSRARTASIAGQRLLVVPVFADIRLLSQYSCAGNRASIAGPTASLTTAFGPETRTMTVCGQIARLRVKLCAVKMECVVLVIRYAAAGKLNNSWRMKRKLHVLIQLEALRQAETAWTGCE